MGGIARISEWIPKWPEGAHKQMRGRGSTSLPLHPRANHHPARQLLLPPADLRANLKSISPPARPETLGTYVSTRIIQYAELLMSCSITGEFSATGGNQLSARRRGWTPVPRRVSLTLCRRRRRRQGISCGLPFLLVFYRVRKRER